MPAQQLNLGNGILIGPVARQRGGGQLAGDACGHLFPLGELGITDSLIGMDR
ncbi:Uncharacterised protein [Mycobacteroides abscessus subsp. abscessus]|nr:Uncharacterised protein [Mycobacteroides abscessus subsp. abscessus]